MILWLACLAGLTAALAVPPPALTRLRTGDRRARDDRDVSPGYPLYWRIAGGCTVLLITVLLWPSVTAALVGLALAGAMTMASAYLPRATDHRQLTNELPDALDLLAVCLEAGAPTSQAVAVVAEVSPPATAAVLGRVMAHLAVGRAPDEAWEELREHPVWAGAARDLVRSARSGTSLVDTLRAHADDARRERQDAATRRARSVGVKSVLPLMVCFLPAFVLVGVVPIVGSLLGDFFG